MRGGALVRHRYHHGYESQTYGWNAYYPKRVIKPEVYVRFKLFLKHFSNVPKDLQVLLMKHLFERVVFARTEPVRQILAWKQTEEVPVLDKMLLQDLAIAQWFSKNKKVAPKGDKAFIYDATENTMALCRQFRHTVYQDEPYWLDQCQVANWAIQGLEQEWKVYCLFDAMEEVPLYYLILTPGTADMVEMKGIWRSLYGTLRYKQLGKEFPKGRAFYLLSEVISYRQLNPDAMVRVQLRVGLKKMLNKHGVCVQHVGKIPKTQGSSIPGQFPVLELLEMRNKPIL